MSRLAGLTTICGRRHRSHLRGSRAGRGTRERRPRVDAVRRRSLTIRPPRREPAVWHGVPTSGVRELPLFASQPDHRPITRVVAVRRRGLTIDRPPGSSTRAAFRRGVPASGTWLRQSARRTLRGVPLVVSKRAESRRRDPPGGTRGEGTRRSRDRGERGRGKQVRREGVAGSRFAGRVSRGAGSR